LLTAAGAEFAEHVLHAAFGGKKQRPVQAYVFLGADAGGEAVKKEIGAELDYFSVNVELGVSHRTNGS
jgi:malate dehydrogenase